MVVIAVAGSASRSLPPERGTVHLRVAAEGSTSAEAADPVRPVLARLIADARASEAAGEATRWSAASIATSVETRYLGHDREPQRVHVASAPVEVRFRDLDALRRWIGALLDDAVVRIESIDWSLTDPTRAAVERDLRADAARDATGRAGDYAAALGLAELRAVRLWEDGLRPSDDGGGPVLMSARAITASTGEEVDLHPAPIVLEVRVLVDFEASEGGFTAGG